jgi:virginiamycin B lyase
MNTSPASNRGSLLQYLVPAQAGGLSFIVSGPDGNLWFQNVTNSAVSIVKMNTNGAILAQYPLISNAINALTSGPNNMLWATVFGAPHIFSITTEGSITNYALPTGYNTGAGEFGDCLTTGPDGNLWFGAQGPDSAVIGSMTPIGTFTWYPLSDTISINQNLITGSDGNLWFCATVLGSPNQSAIGTMTLTGTVTTYTMPADYIGGGTNFIVGGPDGNLWFTGYDNSNNPYIGSSTTSGTITTYSLPSGYDSGTDGASVSLIISGPGESLWFSGVDNNGNNYLASTTTGGVVTPYSLNTDNFLFDVVTLATGSDGNLWFSQGGGMATRFTI